MKTAEEVAADTVYQNGGDGAHAFRNIIAGIEADRAQRESAPKLIAGLALWNPGAEYHIEYRSLEFSGALAEQFVHASEHMDYANARQFVIAVPGDLNDEGIVKFLDARIESIKAGYDVWTTGLVLKQA